MERLLKEAKGRIGLFGGTFDPPHWGHIRAVIGAADELTLSQIAFLPSPQPPHKHNKVTSPYSNRCRMVELCLPLDPRVRLCLIEENGLPGTTLETIRKLRRDGFTEERCHLVWLMGSDSLLDMLEWHKPDELLKSVEVAVMPRSGFPAEKAEARFLQKVTILNTPLIEIAATKIRNGEYSLSEVVPPQVEEYIRKNGLYDVGESS